MITYWYCTSCGLPLIEECERCGVECVEVASFAVEDGGGCACVQCISTSGQDLDAWLNSPSAGANTDPDFEISEELLNRVRAEALANRLRKKPALTEKDIAILVHLRYSVTPFERDSDES